MQGSDLPATDHLSQDVAGNISIICMTVCPCRREKIDFWDNVYGFDFSAIKRLAMQEPLVDVVDHEQVITEPCKLSTFNISEMTKADAAFTVSAHP